MLQGIQYVVHSNQLLLVQKSVLQVFPPNNQVRLQQQNTRLHSIRERALSCILNLFFFFFSGWKLIFLNNRKWISSNFSRIDCVIYLAKLPSVLRFHFVRIWCFLSVLLYLCKFNMLGFAAWTKHANWEIVKSIFHYFKGFYGLNRNWIEKLIDRLIDNELKTWSSLMPHGFLFCFVFYSLFHVTKIGSPCQFSKIVN